MRDIIESKEIKVNEKNIIPLAEVKEESDVTLNLELYKNNMPFDVTGQSIKLGLLINNELIGEQSDGITINKNVVTIKLKNSFIQPGKLELDLTLTDNTGRMTTSSFYLIVNKKTIGGTSVQGTDLLETLDKIILYFKVNSQKAIDGFIAESTELLTNIKKNGEKTINDIKSNYDSLKQIIIDENQAANLQEQINENKSEIYNLKNTNTQQESEISDLKGIAEEVIEARKNKAKLGLRLDDVETQSVKNANSIKECIKRDGSVPMTGTLKIIKDSGGISLENSIGSKVNLVVPPEAHGILKLQLKDSSGEIMDILQFHSDALKPLRNGINLGTQSSYWGDVLIDNNSSDFSLKNWINKLYDSDLLSTGKFRFNSADGEGARLIKPSWGEYYMFFHMAIDIGNPQRYVIGYGARHRGVGDTHIITKLSNNGIDYGAKNSQGTQVINGADASVIRQFVIACNN